MNDTTEKPAVSVIDEAANTYYDKYMLLPDDNRKRISIAMLRNIFDTMVIPAIEIARAMDRQGRQANETDR